MRYDVVVIGGGHNGLTAAAYLARAGRSVLVLERRHVVGGAAVTEEVFPGFKFSVCSYVVSLLRPEIIRELDLPRHGMELLPLDGTFTPMPNGAFLAGITRQRAIKLMRADGISVVEATLRYKDFETADEIFATGNASKVMPIDPQTGKPTRVRVKVQDGKKVRIAKSGTEIVAQR